MTILAPVITLLLAHSGANLQTPVSGVDESVVEESEALKGESQSDHGQSNNRAPRDYSADPVPIIVTGAREGKAKKVIVGSRIPRRSQFSEGQFATNTRLHGLTPGSGMDPMGSMAGNLRKLTRRECRAEDEAIGHKAACVLLAAQSDFAANQTESGIGMLRALALSDEFSATERLAGAKELYAKGAEISDNALRLHALELMIGTGALPEQDDIAARRTIVALALVEEQQELAIQTLLALDTKGSARPRDLANLAILQRQTGNDKAARQTMSRAIALSETQGKRIPLGWHDFLIQPSATN